MMRISCLFQGIDAEYVSLENIVPEVEGSDESFDATLDHEFYDRLIIALAERINRCGPRIPVITGLFDLRPNLL